MNIPSAADLERRLAGLSAAQREQLERKLQERRGGGMRHSEIRCLEERTSAPLSFAQQRLWFLDRLEEGSSSYNVASAVLLKGPLNIDALERAVTSVVHRHATLRTRFPEVDGTPVQVIDPPGEVPFPIDDLTMLAESEKDAEVARRVHEEAKKPFDIARGSVFRAGLLRVRAEEAVFFCTLHHIVSDAWSRTILFRELASFYEAFSLGHEPSLPRLPIQYGDYAEWQREWLRSGEMQSQLEYWQEQLKGELPVLELPTDHPRPPVATLRGGRRQFTIVPSVAGRLKTFCRAEGVTLFMASLAAFTVLLRRYSGQDDVIV
ncbi:MAG TPA: condensation domain-containing protein, partial [Thermoanaerobaculia bacterium]|nr:condensation domain-containing protein [Thermoanaerobaculia bacterium]